jgi:hypothetical protein
MARVERARLCYLVCDREELGSARAVQDNSTLYY